MEKVSFFLKSAQANYSDQRGQVLIIVLLVLVVGVSIVLSLSARSLTDIRTTTSTEQSNRAYFAAEAGIERALQQIKDSNITGDTDIVGGGTGNKLSNNAFYDGQIKVTGGNALPFSYDGVKDVTFQTNLKPDINQTTFSNTSFGLQGGTVTVFWHTGTDADPRSALEITILKVNSAGNYAVDKYACDKNSGRSALNGFNCAGLTSPGANCATSVVTSNKGTINYCYQATLNLPTTVSGYKAVLMRTRPLYSGDSVAVRFNGPDTLGNTNLPQQGYEISSTGVGPDGASRKLVVFRSFPSLPTVFDFVLYNGSNNPLTKP